MMSNKIDTADIPQANDLEKVIKTLVAIASGRHTDKKIAEFIGFTPRQGRYYRRAAEVLGLISNKDNYSTLTERGKDFLQALESNSNPMALLQPYIVELPVVREVMEIFGDDATVKLNDFLNVLSEVSDFAPNDTTARRRLSTLIRWLIQVGLLNENKAKGLPTYKFVPYVPLRPKSNPKIASRYETFKSTILPFLNIAQLRNDEDKKFVEAVSLILNANEDQLSDLVTSDRECAKVARLICNISEKEILDLATLKKEIQHFKNQELSLERLIIERSRCLRATASTISAGGVFLEASIESWFEKHGIEAKRHYSFKGTSKNCDFFVERLSLAIESKYSKTSGTKHEGAIKDISEIAKAKQNHKDLLVGVVLGGKGFLNNAKFWNAIKKLHSDGKLDFVLSPKDLKSLKPTEIKRMRKLPPFSEKDLELPLDEYRSSWSAPMTDEEMGLSDAVMLFRLYANATFLNFESLLQTWISHTPYAIQCLRLILNWSESQMESFIAMSVPTAASEWKTEIRDFDRASILVKSLSNQIDDTDKHFIRKFLQLSPSYADLLSARRLGLSQWARKKKEINEVFTKLCAETVTSEVIRTQVSAKLPNGGTVKPSFSIKENDGKITHVLCKYYSSHGSVMSDLVKTAEGLALSEHKDNWLLITDGPGWLKRDKDLRRLLSIAENTSFRVMNLSMWEAQFRALKRHTP